MSQDGPGRIRWVDESIAAPAIIGFADGADSPLFRIWKPAETVPWILLSRLPGMLGREAQHGDPKTLRMLAEQWLTDAERGGVPLSDQDKNG